MKSAYISTEAVWLMLKHLSESQAEMLGTQ